MMPVLERISVVDALPETNRLVVVEFVFVEFCAVKLFKVLEPLTMSEFVVRVPTCAPLALRSVVDASPAT